MEENSATNPGEEASPIFGAFRRGYDPDQVDRYVADQRRRLDEALHRASESERRLAAAVGQLRELHRRVAVLESEERTAQPQPLDTLGERVQRILQEAWDGAYAIRQSVEQETNELRARATAEAEEIVAAAQRKAEAVEEEIARRRRAYLERIEQERSRTASQMTYLHEQRQLALSELSRIKTLIEATVSEVDAGADPRRDHAADRAVHASAGEVLEQLNAERELASVGARSTAAPAPDGRAEAAPAHAERPARPAPVVAAPEAPARRIADEELPKTMPVHRLDLSAMPESEADRSQLVQSARDAQARHASVREISSARERRSQPSVFDFEAEEPK